MKQQIIIYGCNAMGKETTMEVSAIVRGEWAIHKAGGYMEDGYTLTHIPSGAGKPVPMYPADLAHLLRDLQTMRPCPSTAEEMRVFLRKGKKPESYKAWVRDLISILAQNNILYSDGKIVTVTK